MIKNKKILVTGGLGFIGFNAACYFAKNNHVLVADNCSRPGVENHIAHLKKTQIDFSPTDISRFKELREVFYAFGPDIIIHMAAQVAVTLSISNPFRDFRSNVQGSFNLLELARNSRHKPIMLYASTNKVYGGNPEKVELKNGRYVSRNPLGYSEESLLSFETPYGCSKGAADQYFIDYSRTYGIPTVVFRQSCIYGPHQYGLEDQGWVAWFAICSLLGKPVTIFGDGNQVRDVLYIDDLIELYEKAILDINTVKGEVFNIGGGPQNTLSLNELIRILEEQPGKPLKVSFADWRPHDQKVYISDIRKAERLLDWRPKTNTREGVKKLLTWLSKEREVIDFFNIQCQGNHKQYDATIVIPAKNEEASLGAVLDEINFLLSSSSYSYEVIVVNDRSTDRTAEIARQYPFVKLIDNNNPPGKGAALRCGFDIANGTYIVMMDADFSHDVSDLPFMMDEAKRHRGLVVASRITGGSEEYTRIRALGNVVLTWFFGFMHGRYLSDALNGYKVFHRDIYFSFKYTATRYEIEIELLVNALRLQRQITEISSRERPRLGGKMKSSVIRDGTRFTWRTFVEYFRKPKIINHEQTSLVPHESALHLSKPIV